MNPQIASNGHVIPVDVASHGVIRLPSPLARKDSEHEQSRENRRWDNGVGRSWNDGMDGHRTGQIRCRVNAARLPSGAYWRSAGLVRISTVVRSFATYCADHISTQATGETATAIRSGTGRESAGTAYGVSLSDSRSSAG